MDRSAFADLYPRAFADLWADATTTRALTRDVCERLAVPVPRLTLVKRPSLFGAGRYRFESAWVFNFHYRAFRKVAGVMKRHDHWNIETHLHELAHHVGQDRIQNHGPAFREALADVADAAAAALWGGRVKP